MRSVKHFFSYLCLSLFFLITCQYSIPPSQDTFHRIAHEPDPKVISKRTLLATVRIGVKDPDLSRMLGHDEPKIVGIGSGFLHRFELGQKIIIVTAAHVVSEDDDKKILWDEIYFGNLFIGRMWSKAEVVHVSVKNDLAILYSDGRALYNGPTLELERGRYIRGEEVFFCGYPKNDHAWLTRGTLVSIQDKSFEGGPVYFVSGNILPGYSGGPTVSLHSGRVVGIIQGIIGMRFHNGYIRGPGVIVTSTHIAEVLSDPGSFTLYKDDEPAKE